MGELAIRRNRGTPVARQQEVGKAGKASGSSRSQAVSPKPGVTVSETLRQLMSSQAVNNSRESRRTLQIGEAVLAEVQEKLGRIAELAQEASGGGEPDRAALQAELEQLRGEIDRIMRSAVAGGAQLFLDEAGPDGGVEALLEALGEAGQEGALPDWLVSAITQDPPTAEQLLRDLGLDKTASAEDIMAAIAGRPLEGSRSVSYLAALYLGAVIANGGPSEEIDPEAAMAGLRQLLEKVAAGASPDEAIAELTGGAFTSFADFQSQFTGGTAPDLSAFLEGLLLSESGPLLFGTPGLDLLAGAEGMNLALLLNLLTASPGSGGSAAAGMNPSGAAGPGASAGGELPLEAAPMEGAAGTAPSAPVSTQEFGPIQVTGQDLSGVSFDAAKGELTVGGTADVTIQTTPAAGQGEPAILVTGSGTVTLQTVRASALTVDAAAARVFCTGETALHSIQLREGVSLTLGGSGPLSITTFQANHSNTLHLAGGTAVVVRGADGTLGTLALPVVLHGPVSLAAQAAHVSSPEGKPMEPFDIVWKTLLPGWGAITSLTVDGRQAKMALWGGDPAIPVRLWLGKGDQGYPAHAVTIQGRDEAGRAMTRYAYLRWSQRTGAFQEAAMYPNPFTITGGEPDRDWVYEEASHTLHILSNQVTAIAGGAGTDTNQSPFSGRIALADSIGTMGLTLGGVVCRVTAGRAFHLGKQNHVTLLLQGGTSSCFESGAGCAGISLGEGTSLCIGDAPGSRDGVLTATGGSGGAGIGRDSGGGSGQNSQIQITGGIITATGTGGGAGIGAGKHGPMGPVTITGGTVTSTGAEGGGAGIGGALGAPVGDISIRGGTITALATDHAAAIGAGVQGESGDILITGTARIVKALGGNPGADIGACLFGGCGKVLISGGADIGNAKPWTRAGISLQMGEDTVTLPQFRLSARALRLNRLCVSTRERARVSRATIEADQRWVAQIQAAYSALHSQLEQSFNGLLSTGSAAGPVRDTSTASTLLEGMRQSILRQSSQAMRASSKRGAEDIWQLLW